MLGILGEREQFSMGSRVAIAGTSLLTVIGLVVAACKGGSADTCTTDNYCNEQSGGLCLAESGKQECAYPDTSCPNGYRFSDGACVMDGFQHLTVQLSGDGAGTVSSSPAGLTCSGMTCTGTFQAGVSVSLSATATTGSFLGWSGDGCQGTNGCTVVLDQDQTVQALFGAPGQARWADMISSSTETNGQGMAVDSAGDLIVVGHFGGTLVQAPVTSTGLDDGYVAKLNHTDGSVVWIKSFGGTQTEYVKSVALDSSDNIYVGGSYQGTVTIGSSTLTPSSGDGDLDGYVAKFSADGTPQWAVPFHNNFYDAEVSAIAVTADGVAVTGWFDSNAGSDFYTGSIHASGAGGHDVFVAKVTAAGTASWMVSKGGSSAENGNGIAVDSAGNVVVVGDFASSNVNFGGGAKSSVGMADMFLLKLSGTDGSHLIDREFGSTGVDVANAVAIDTQDAIVVTGQFHGTIDFGTGTPLTAGPVSAYPNIDTGTIVVAKYMLAGSCVWAKSFFSTASVETATAVTTNASGDVVLGGSFCGTISFGGSQLASANDCSLSSYGTIVSDVYAARLAGADGSHLDSIRAGGTGDEQTTSVAEDASGAFYLGGTFHGFGQFGNQALQAPAAGAAFVLALAPL